MILVSWPGEANGKTVGKSADRATACLTGSSPGMPVLFARILRFGRVAALVLRGKSAGVDLLAAAALAFVALASPAAAQTTAEIARKLPGGCYDPAYKAQDFAKGNWDIYEGSKKIAEARVESSLDGCAITEHWSNPYDTKGNGLGLFSYSPVLKSWPYAQRAAVSTGPIGVVAGSVATAA